MYFKNIYIISLISTSLFAGSIDIVNSPLSSQKKIDEEIIKETIRNIDIKNRESTIIIKKTEDVPFELKTKMVNYADFTNNKTFEEAIEILIKKYSINIIIESEVDIKKIVNIKVQNKSIYDTLKDICDSLGYNLNYNSENNSLYISKFKVFEFNIGANQQNIQNLFKNIGSKDIQISYDIRTGKLYIKDSPFYEKTIKEKVLDVASNAKRKFFVRLITIEESDGKKNTFENQTIISNYQNFSFFNDNQNTFSIIPIAFKENVELIVDMKNSSTKINAKLNDIIPLGEFKNLKEDGKTTKKIYMLKIKEIDNVNEISRGLTSLEDTIKKLEAF